MAETSQAATSAFTQANAAPTPSGMQEQETAYEVGFHLLPVLDEKAVQDSVDAIRAALSKQGAHIVTEHLPERMTLAYRIERSISGKREKYTESYFGWIKFTAESQAIPALSEAYKNMYNVLRFIIVEATRSEMVTPRRAVFISDRLEGATIQKPTVASEKSEEVSDEDLDKSIEALVS